MQKAWMLAAVPAALFVYHTNAEIREVAVTGGRAARVAADGSVSFKGIPFAAPAALRAGCLHVNVWTPPARTAGDKLPMMAGSTAAPLRVV